ncbi:MAG: hypothetical protein ACREQT_01385 [Candidatus Binataceae bacterium]
MNEPFHLSLIDDDSQLDRAMQRAELAAERFALRARGTDAAEESRIDGRDDASNRGAARIAQR